MIQNVLAHEIEYLGSMLDIRDVRKSFDGLTVLDGIDLDVNKGDVTAILGPSGSGKTTFLSKICFRMKSKISEVCLIFGMLFSNLFSMR